MLIALGLTLYSQLWWVLGGDLDGVVVDDCVGFSGGLVDVGAV